MASIVFLVDGYLFRVPRYYFASCSDIFCSVFSLPTDGSKSIEGSSDEEPFHLEGISRTEFKSFLRVMYPLKTTILGGEPALSKSEWIAALKLATLWNFRDIRQLAISRLSDLTGSKALTATEKITLAKAYKVSRWLLQGYHDLSRRTQVISVDEARTLGIETTVLLHHVREQIASTFCSPSTHAGREFFNVYVNRREEQNFESMVRKTFKEELDEVELANQTYNTLPAAYNTQEVLEDLLPIATSQFRSSKFIAS